MKNKTADRILETTGKGNITIREGTYSDNEGLVSLTSQTPMKGNISLKINRSPDFFALLEKRGPYFVIVAQVNNNIIGSYSASATEVYIDGKRETVYYLGDFKVHPDYRKSTVAARLALAVMNRLKSMNADFLFCTVAHGNDDVLPFFKGRAFLPMAEAIGIFNVFQIIPTPFKIRNNKYQMEQGCVTPLIVGLFNTYMKRFQLGSIYSERSLENTMSISASINNKVVAAITLSDTASVKQNILIRLPFYLNTLVRILNAINTIFPIARLPRIGEVVQVLYIKSLACEPGYEDALISLIGRARNLAYEKRYHFLTIGIHDKDPLLKIFSRYPKFTFKSMGFVASLNNTEMKINSILKGIPFEDYSLV